MRNYRLINLTSISWKIIMKSSSEFISRHKMNKKVIDNSYREHGIF